MPPDAMRAAAGGDGERNRGSVGGGRGEERFAVAAALVVGKGERLLNE